MQTNTLLVTLPLVLVLLYLAYAVLRNLLRVWLQHRVKMALLEKLERRPELVEGLTELQEILDGPQEQQEEKRRQMFLFTGIFLALIGISCAVLAQTFFSGRYATGFYFGGIACVPIGFMLTLLGMIMKYLGRTPVPRRQ